MALAQFLQAALPDAGELLPYRISFGNRADLIGLHVAADGVIALACLAIPAALLWFMSRRRAPLAFGWLLVLVAGLFALVGLGHVLDIVTIWQPAQTLQAYAKGLTAVGSVAAAIALIPRLPRLLAMRSAEELAQASQRLREEVAARELAEEDLRRALADTRRAVLELEQYAYITSHDLQAPLRTISGFSQLLLRRYQARLDGDALEFIDYIERGCRQMQAQILALLELSRVGRSGSTGFERRPLAETVARAIRAVQAAIDRSGAEIVLGVLPEIEASHEMLVQLLQHLIDNAIRFQKPGQKPHITITIERLEDEWDLVVADQGIGIPPEQLENVFAIFRRLHPGGDDSGTGIGLAICRKIAQFHGGEIRAESDGEGTRFHVRLPVSPSTQRRLLLAEDDAKRRLAGA